jgi:hypothetical protein
VWGFYNGLLGQAQQRGFTLDLQNFHRPAADLSDLEQIFTEEEVWNTVKAMPSDKAPGPDRYTARFYKAVWQVIKGNFMAAISRLIQGGVIRLYLLNSAYITLLPKTVEALEIKDYRPISLVHSFAKTVTKILANRLAPKLSNLVAANQSAFVKGRCIHDNFLMVQGTATALHGHKQPRVLLKLDITKAFDSVSWPFLLEFCNIWGLDLYGVILFLNCSAHPPPECWLMGSRGI